MLLSIRFIIHFDDEIIRFSFCPLILVNFSVRIQFYLSIRAFVKSFFSHSPCDWDPAHLPPAMHPNRNHPLCRTQSYGPTNWNSNYDRADCKMKTEIREIFNSIKVCSYSIHMYLWIQVCRLYANANYAEFSYGITELLVEYTEPKREYVSKISKYVYQPDYILTKIKSSKSVLGG